MEAVSDLVAGLPMPERSVSPGGLAETRLTALLAHSSVFCLPSTDEGVPMALLESMALRARVRRDAVGGMPEVVVDGQNGVLVEARMSDALAEALRSLLSDAPETYSAW